MTDDEILAANAAYGGLAELAVLVLPPQHLAAIARKLDLTTPPPQQQQPNASHPQQNASPMRHNNRFYSKCEVAFLQEPCETDIMASIRDPNVREVIAKETLTYKSKERPNPEQEAKNIKALENLVEVWVSVCGGRGARARATPCVRVHYYVAA